MAERTVLGERLLLARRRKGLTQKELGDMVGVSPRTIARIEQGRAPQILTGALERMSRVLDVSTDFLLGLAEDPGPLGRTSRPSGESGESDDLIGTPSYVLAVES